MSKKTKKEHFNELLVLLPHDITRSALQCKGGQPSFNQRDIVCCGKRLQMAGIVESLRQAAYQITFIDIEILALGSACIKQSIEKTRGGWNSKLYAVSADGKVVVGMLLSGGECHDTAHWLMAWVIYRWFRLGENRKELREHDKELYKHCNVVECLLRRLKEFHRLFTHYDKLDVIYMGFVLFCFCMIWIR